MNLKFADLGLAEPVDAEGFLTGLNRAANSTATEADRELLADIAVCVRDNMPLL